LVYKYRVFLVYQIVGEDCAFFKNRIVFDRESAIRDHILRDADARANAVIVMEFLTRDESSRLLEGEDAGVGIATDELGGGAVLPPYDIAAESMGEAAWERRHASDVVFRFEAIEASVVKDFSDIADGGLDSNTDATGGDHIATQIYVGCALVGDDSRDVFVRFTSSDVDVIVDHGGVIGGGRNAEARL